MALAAPAQSVPLPAADDLARTGQEARARRIPVLLAFMQKTCPYCARARNHLEPLRAGAEWGRNAIMLEIDVDSPARLRDFDGRWTTPRDFSRRLGIRMVPTVMVFDAEGRVAAEPVVGLAIEDFYTAYLERALETAAAKIAAAGGR